MSTGTAECPRSCHALHTASTSGCDCSRTQFPAQTFSRKQNIQIQLFETINHGSRNPIIKAMRVRHNAITIQCRGKHRGVSRSRKACTPANSSTSLRFAPCQTWMRATTSQHWGNPKEAVFHINNSPPHSRHWLCSWRNARGTMPRSSAAT